MTASILMFSLSPLLKLVTTDARSCIVASLGIDDLKLSELNLRPLFTSIDESLNLILLLITVKNSLKGFADSLTPLSSFSFTVYVTLNALPSFPAFFVFLYMTCTSPLAVSSISINSPVFPNT